MPFDCLVLVRLFSALQNGGIAPHEWIVAKGPLPNFPFAYNACDLTKTVPDLLIYLPVSATANICHNFMDLTSSAQSKRYL